MSQPGPTVATSSTTSSSACRALPQADSRRSITCSGYAGQGVDGAVCWRRYAPGCGRLPCSGEQARHPPRKAQASRPVRLVLAPRLYEEGLHVRWRVGRSLSVSRGSCGAALMSLWPPCGRSGRNWIVRLAGASRLGSVYAARRTAAPRGANFWLRVSMCQIAWASRRAMSTGATLALRCLPSRRLVRW
jgi:hypothetical protein